MKYGVFAFILVCILLFSTAAVIEENAAHIRQADLKHFQEALRTVEDANARVMEADHKLEQADATLKAAADGLDDVNHKLREVNHRLQGEITSLIKACSLSGTAIPATK